MPPLIRPFLVALALASIQASAADAFVLQAAQIKALGIETQVIGEASSARSASYPGQVRVPNEQMRLVTAPVAGRVDMLAVAPGASVRRGQVVAHLASPQALELQRDALQTASQTGLLQQNLKRDEQLFAEGLIAESRLQATRAAASQAAAQASERRQGLALAGIAPGKLGGPLALTAAIDGVVLEQAVQLGERVESSALIFRIAQLSPLWLDIQVPFEIAAHLRPGTSVRISQRNISGKLIAIGRAVDPASQTVLVRAAVTKGAETLYPGQVLEVEIASPGGPGQNLPASALSRHEGKTLVFIQTTRSDQGTSFRAQAVNIISQGGDSAVVDGLKAGESVAVKGVSGLKAIMSGVGGE